jgi:Na+(H+)/acetate symporter ActP
MKVKTSGKVYAVAASGCSATMLVGGAGALTAQGHDGLATLLGFAGAVFLAVVIVVPLLNATHSGSIPDAMRNRRVGSGVIGLAQFILAVCTVGLVAAEITAGGWLMARLSGLSFGVASMVVAGLMALVVVGCAFKEPRLRPAAWIDGLIAALIVIALLMLLSMIARPGMVPGSALLMEPALSDIARLETQLIEKRLADPALLKPHAVPFLRTTLWNFLALIACLAGGLALLWPMRAGVQTTWSRVGARVGILATMAPLLLLAPFAAEAKRALLLAFDGGLRPSALPNWLQTYQALGAVQICGSTSLDAAAVTRACGKGVGAQGFMRWHEATFAPDALALVGLDALGAPTPVLSLFGLSVLLAALILTVNLTGSATTSLGRDAGPLTVLARVALVAAGGLVAWLQPADSLTLVAWTASVALAGLGPVCLALSVFGSVNGRAAVLAIVIGVVLTSLMILAPRYLPLGVADLTGALANAPPTIVRRIATLRESLATLPTGDAQAAAALMAERLARDHVTWVGLKPIASGVWGFLIGCTTLVVGQLLSGLLGYFARHKT